MQLVRALFRRSENGAVDSDKACLKRLRQLNQRRGDDLPLPTYSPMHDDAGADGLRANEQSCLSRWRMRVQGDALPFESNGNGNGNGYHHPVEQNQSFFIEPTQAHSEPLLPQQANSFERYPTIDLTAPLPQAPPRLEQEYNLEPSAHSSEVVQYELSESALREILRIQLNKRGLIARSLVLAEGGGGEEIDPQTQLAQDWNCSGVHALLQLGNTGNNKAPLLAENNTQQIIDSTEPTAVTRSLEPLQSWHEEAVQPPLDAVHLQMEAPQPPPPPSKPTWHSAQNPYRHYSETALIMLAGNPSTPPASLFWLCLHSNPDIRAAVARNINCSPEALAFLGKDHEAGIRHAVAENPRASVSLLEALAGDRNPLIAWRAQNHLNEAQGRQTVHDLKLPDWKKQAEKDAITQTGNHKHLHSPTLPYSDELSASEETIAFLGLIARKTNTPGRRLAELARHPDARVRAAVAENANTPLELIWLLAKDDHQEVKLKVTENYNCPLDVLEALKEDIDSFVAWQARSVLSRLTAGAQAQIFVDGGARTRGVTSREII